MRFLITGGAGFIGSHLADELLAQGHYVHILDDLSTGSIDNIRHLKDQPRFEYTIDSATARPVVAELVDQADAIYHLAAAVGVELIVESPVRTLETNIHTTEVVLQQANKKKKPVLLTSTSEVYGKSELLPYREDDDSLLGCTNVGRWAYACSKMIDEFLALAYWKERKQPVVVFRLFNTVGPRQTGRYGMVVPKFVRQALANQAIAVHGDGEQRRCFCHVEDAVSALVGGLQGEECFGGVYNIGTTEEISINALAHKIREKTDSESEIQLVSYEDAFDGEFEDMTRRVPNIEKIKQTLGWEPLRSLDETLHDVIEFQRGTVELEADSGPVISVRKTHVPAELL